MQFGEDEEDAMVRVCMICHTLSVKVCVQSRPFGTALLMAGVDEGGPKLYVMTMFNMTVTLLIQVSCRPIRDIHAV